MSNLNYLALAGRRKPSAAAADPHDARISALWMDDNMVDGCMFNQACWYVKDCVQPGLIKHDSDEVLFFIGGDPDNPADLNCSVEIWIENDKLTLTKSCEVFVPAGAAHGNMRVTGLSKPFFWYSCHLNSGQLLSLPAEATAAPGTFANQYVEGYERPDGTVPEAPEGFIKFVAYLDGVRLKGAPYAEIVWFCTPNDTGPAPHSHDDFDEFIGFIGSESAHPEELNAEVEFFIEGEKITITKSCLIYIPRGITHSPIYVPKLDRPIYHFSGGNGGDYARRGDENRNNNMFRNPA